MEALCRELEISKGTFYLPYLDQAISDGKVSLNQALKVSRNDAVFYGYMRVKKSMEYPHVCYDVSAFKDNYREGFLSAPLLANDIFLDMKASCGFVDYFFVYYAKNVQARGHEFIRRSAKSDLGFDIIDRVQEVCPDYDGKKQGWGGHICLPNYIYLKDKEFFCVIYDKE